MMWMEQMRRDSDVDHTSQGRYSPHFHLNSLIYLSVENRHVPDAPLRDVPLWVQLDAEEAALLIDVYVYVCFSCLWGYGRYVYMYKCVHGAKDVNRQARGQARSGWIKSTRRRQTNSQKINARTWSSASSHVSALIM